MKRASWATILLLAASLALRGTYLAFGPADFQDIDSYGYLVRQLVERGEYARGSRPTAFRPPLYPLVLALVARLQIGLGSDPLGPVGIASLHLALGLGTVYLTLLLGSRLGLGGFAYVGAGLVAVDPLLVYHSGLVMTETLFTLLVVGLLVSLTGAHAQRSADRGGASGGEVVRLLIAGVLLGLAALCRPTIWAFLPLVLIAQVACHGQPRLYGDWKPVLVPVGCILFAMGITVAPWAVRNERVLGQPVVTTTHGGETFWRANNRWFYDGCIRDGSGTWQDTTAWEQRRAQVTAGLSEVEADRACYREAWDTIRERPADFVRAVLYRWRSLWRPWPSAAVYGGTAAFAIGIFYSLQFLCALVGLCRREAWRWPWILLPLLLVSVTAVHALYWTDLRMRAPLMPAVALLGAAGCRTLFSQRTRLPGFSTP
jgi:4-amino-4-deoxy-L-arabinose transferase-like glycosyltransferase